MQLGARIGAPTLYKYYEAFGLFQSTNSGLYGEQSSIFHDLDDVGPVELATMSFVQRLNAVSYTHLNFSLYLLNFFLLPVMVLKSHIQNLVYGKSFSFLSLAHINQIWLL